MSSEGEEKQGADVAQEAAPQATPPKPQTSQWWEGGQQKATGEEFHTRRLDTPLDRLVRKRAGRRSVTKTERKRGRYIQSRIPRAGKKLTDLAFDATFRAAAPYQRYRDRSKMALALQKSDLREKVRVRRSANLILFAVDASWSMAVSERMQATKGAIMSLLTDAYQRRDRVGLIVFHKNSANLVLKPTNSVTLAKQALREVQVGGKTPLSAGLLMAHEVVLRESYTHPDVEPLIILLTDGAGNVSITAKPPKQEAHEIADGIRMRGIRSVVINMEHPAFDQGYAAELAEHLGAPCHRLQDLRAETLYRAVVDQLS